MSALAMSGDVSEQLSPPVEARRLLAEGEVVILAAGTGNPYFTTDSAASLSVLIEMECRSDDQSDQGQRRLFGRSGETAGRRQNSIPT